MAGFKIVPLPYQQVMRKKYSLMSDLPGFVLLESTDSIRGRYDIMSAYPYHRFKISADASDIGAALDDLDSLLPKETLPLDLPFQGGAIGFVSYDLGERLVGIQSRPQANLADMPLLDFGLYDWAIITDHHLKQVTLFAANRQPETLSIIDEVLTLWEKKQPDSHPFSLDKRFEPLISQASYQTAFETIHEEIRRGRCYQVNYTQPFTTSFTGSSWGMFDTVSQKNPVPFAAYLNFDDASILSFSPERYLLMNEGQLLASPIKGSIKRSTDAAIDLELKNQLLGCSKNRAENVMIVDLMRNDLGKISKPGSVQVSALCEAQTYNAVHHLVSDVRSECSTGLTPLQALISCFPGGSITGAPKLESMRMINELEPYSRGAYCGSVVYFSAHGRFDSNIAIRTITAKNNQLHLSAGGGIVIDSNWQEEYGECLIKLTAIFNGLKQNES